MENMENENTLNHVNAFDLYFYLIIAVIIVFCVYCIYKYDVLTRMNEYIENMKTTTSNYLEQKIKERFLQSGILKTTYFPENSILQKVMESFGFL
jgi:hypothetical protein